MAPSLIQDILFQRLLGDGRADDDFAMHVLAACEGQESLERLCDGTARPSKPASTIPLTQTPAVAPTYLTGIQVRSFRGIGEESTLRLTPGPGVTLVVGRNGSGKSSFSEGAEVALTGTSARWVGKGSKEWRKGWRNVHSALPPRLVVETMHVGDPSPSRIERTWHDPEDLDTGHTHVVPPAGPKRPIAESGLVTALQQYRPFLSYSELGGMLEEGPGRIYQALIAGLGLDEYEAVRDVLASAENSRKKIVESSKKAALDLAARAHEAAASHPEESRFPIVAGLLEKRVRDVEAIADLVVARPDDQRGRVLEALATLVPPVDRARVAALPGRLREVAEAQRAMQGRSEDITLKLSEVLRKALALATTSPQDACPVCGSDRPLDATWQAEAATRLRNLDEAATDARMLGARASSLVKESHECCAMVPDALRHATEAGVPGADLALSCWSAWSGGAGIDTLPGLASHIEAHGAAVIDAVEQVSRAADAETRQRDVAWQPLSLEIAQWVSIARAAERAKAAEKPLKDAKSWVGTAIDAERRARFAPIKQQAIDFWNTIAQLSNVTLEDIELTGQGVQQRVTLKVTVDGKEAPALGVLSQGELNAMTLSLFLPRVLLGSTPFGFVIVDDPVQAMDEARVDGLARVLTEVGRQRQVVVFTHDARLPEAFNRLDLPHSKRRVTRGVSSSVVVSPLVGPWEQRLEDASAVASTPNLPEDIAGRVVPGFCRQALEAACVDNLRRRWLLKGDAHAKVDDRLTRKGLTELLCLVFFEDESAHAQLSGRLGRLKVADAAALVRDCQRGAHEGFSGDLTVMASRARTLCEALRKVKGP